MPAKSENGNLDVVWRYKETWVNVVGKYGGERPALAEISHKQFIAISRKSLADNNVLFFPALP